MEIDCIYESNIYEGINRSHSSVIISMATKKGTKNFSSVKPQTKQLVGGASAAFGVRILLTFEISKQETHVPGCLAARFDLTLGQRLNYITIVYITTEFFMYGDLYAEVIFGITIGIFITGFLSVISWP